MGYAYGIRWNEEKIGQGILEVMEVLGVDRMPSSSEVVSVKGNYALSNKIAKTGGYYHWAKKLSLDIKKTETSFGFLYEQKVKDKLEKLGFKVEGMSVKHPYDLLVNDNIKIDVKVAKPCTSEVGTFHTFNLEKRNPTCDIYVAITLTDSNQIERSFVIPSKYLKITQLSVGKVSMYDKYIDKWDYIKKYDEFYESVI